MTQRKCGHPCHLVCHQGECAPSAKQCTEKTVLRCRCAKRTRLSFQCNLAPVNRIEHGDDNEEGEVGDISGQSTITRWLKCDQECKEFAKKAQLVSYIIVLDFCYI